MLLYSVFMSKNTVTANIFKPIKDNVFVTELDHGMKTTQGGIILMDDNMTDRGIRDRWAKVYAIGPDVEDIKPGDWVLIAHGRWTNVITFHLPEGDLKMWRIEYPESVLLVSDEDPRTTNDLKL